MNLIGHNVLWLQTPASASVWHVEVRQLVPEPSINER